MNDLIIGIAFGLLSVIILIGIYSFVGDFVLAKPESKTNVDILLGKIGLVISDVSDYNPGYVKIDGKEWLAISDEIIISGSKVTIVGVEGSKLVVKNIE